jgi:hypothetical protein
VNVIELAGVAEHLHGGSVRRRRRIFEATWSKGAQLHGKQNDGRPIDRFNRNRNSTGIDASGYSEVSSSSGSSNRPSQPCFWQAGRRPFFVSKRKSPQSKLWRRNQAQRQHYFASGFE